MNLIDEVLRLDKEATKGPWDVWDGPAYVGGGADLCIGHGETWLTNMNERHQGDKNITIAQDFGPDSVTEDEEVEITREQRANADAIALYRTAAPKLARALKVAMEQIELIGHMDYVTEKDTAGMLAEIEKELQ